MGECHFLFHSAQVMFVCLKGVIGLCGQKHRQEMRITQCSPPVCRLGIELSSHLLAVGDERVLRRALELDGGGAGVLGQPQRRRERDDVLVEEAGLARRVDRRALQ